MRVREAISTFRGHRVPNLNLIARKRWWFALSGLFIALSIGGLVIRQLNFSIAFTGGSLVQFPDRSGASVGGYQGIMARFGLPDAQVEILGENQVQIRTESLTELGLSARTTAPAASARGDQLRQALANEAGISPNEINEQDVGPTWGKTISRKMITGLIVFLILVTLYITVRFEWKMAIGALVALAHDLVITAGVFALLGREVTPESVIAFLTILGYSLYDTVVIYDKVKENTESAAMVARDTYSGVVNTSLNQTLMRSVNTSLVVLLPIGSLLLFGGQTLKDFAFALFVGVASGTYSSIFVASPILGMLKEREPRYQQLRARAVARAARPGLRAVPTAMPSPTEEAREFEPAAAIASRGSGASGPARPGRPRPGGPKRKKPKPKRRRR